MNKLITKLAFASAFVLLALVATTPSAAADPINLALNPSGVGLPSPLESDPGWGGGSYPWEIVDGLRGYTDWAHGLALAWDGQTHQVTIVLAGPAWFNEVILWHHYYYPISPTLLDFWDGTGWNPITYTRQQATMQDIGSISDIYTFAPVFGSKVRWTVPAGADFGGNPSHEWMYEFEIYNIPEPSTLTLLGIGLVGLIGYGWRTRK